MSGHHTETTTMEQYLCHKPIFDTAKWIEASREVADDSDAFMWALDMRYRGVPLDETRSAHDNLMSFNLMHVRDMPCTPR